MARHARNRDVARRGLAQAEPGLEVVDPREAQLEKMNKGEEPVAARLEVGSEERRAMLQCQKINNRENGLFAITQSSDEQMGTLASLMAREIIADKLGQELDQEIHNLNRTDRSSQEQAAHVDAHVRLKLKEAFQQIADKLAMQTSLVDGLERMSVKPVAVKMVDLPGGTQRMYIGHAGDNRVYLQRGGELYQLTQDQTGLRQQVESGFITEDRYQEIDQAVDPSKLSRTESQMFGMRDDSYEIASEGVPLPKILAFDVAAGDRLVIGNEGLHKNLLTTEIEDVLGSGVFDDRSAEKVLQKSADNQVGAALPRERSQAREITAVVYTIPEGGRGDQLKDDQEKERADLVKKLEAKIKKYDLETRNCQMLARDVEHELKNPRMHSAVRTAKESRLEELRKSESSHRQEARRARDQLSEIQ